MSSFGEGQNREKACSFQGTNRSAAVATGRVLLALSEQRSVHASRDIREIAVTASTDILEKSGKQNTTTL